MIINSMTHKALTRHGARALDLLDTYWTGLATRGQLPLWTDLDPSRFQDALDHAFLAECHGTSHARFRVAGSAVADLVGQPCPGLPLSLMIRSKDRPAFNAAIATCRTGRAMDLTLNAAAGAASARMVLYPLVDTTGVVTQMLGGLAGVTESGPHHGPFSIATAQACPTPARRSCLRLVVDNT
jgi:hypothetical protein